MAVSAWAGFQGVKELGEGRASAGLEARISLALAALAPDAATARQIWMREMEDALRPRRGAQPDTELAVSLAHAFEDVAGRERFASLAWGEMRGLEPTRVEAVLRALPVWVRSRELERVHRDVFTHTGMAYGVPPALHLASLQVQQRLERAQRLYQVSEQASHGFFAGHERGAFNLGSLPGLGLDNDIWLLPDSAVLSALCTQEASLECAMAQIGMLRDRGGNSSATAQGARLFRAGLTGGIVTPRLAGRMAAMEPDLLEALSVEMGRAARASSNTSAIRLMAHLDTEDDVVRLRRVAQAVGPRTLAVFHLLGDSALQFAGMEPDTPVMTRAALEYFIVAMLFSLLAGGMVASAIVSAARVQRSRRAGLGQRLDIAARELLLGRKV